MEDKHFKLVLLALFILFISFNLWYMSKQYRPLLQFHKHKCPKCNSIWEHANYMNSDIKAHTCPKCGYIGEETFKGFLYEGQKEKK